MANNQTEGGAAPSLKKDFFGHPRGLSTLFFTEFWERFSYYGMRALLVLFMVAEASGNNPGLGFSVGRAAAIYGLYTFFVYVLSLPGGWIADNLWGSRKSVFVGGCIIAAGHFSMAIPTTLFFFIGLALIVVGTGLLKPNVSSMVGEIYPEGGARRDAGFSIFYMGINFGAILGPLLCGILGEGYNWHLGFSLAGIGMVIGLICYKLGGKFLGNAGLFTTNESDEAINKRSRRFYGIVSATLAVIVLFGFLMSSGAIGITLKGLAGILGVSVLLIVILFFAYLILDKKWIIPILAITVAAFFVTYPMLDFSTFQADATSEITSELAQMIEKNRVDPSAIQPLTEQNVSNIQDWDGDAIDQLVGTFSTAEVLTLSNLSPNDVDDLAKDKLYIFALQIAVTIAFIFFILVCIARLFLPGVEVPLEKKRLMVIFWLFILAALFWSGFEQAGSSINLFTQNMIDRTFGPSTWLAGWGSILITIIIAIPAFYVAYRIWKKENLWPLAKWIITIASAAVVVLLYILFRKIGLGWVTPASTLQLINPTFIVIMAPVFGWLWTWLAARNANPSIPVKFGLGLLGLSAGFFVISWGAANATGPNSVAAAWLIVTYFLHTCGELCLSPVGLSSMTKLAPKGRVSQMMGIWFVATALGNLIAGLVAGSLETLPASSLFWSVAIIVGGGGVVALLASPFVKKLMGDVE